MVPLRNAANIAKLPELVRTCCAASPPWSVEELDACNLVRDQSHSALCEFRRLLEPE